MNWLRMLGGRAESSELSRRTIEISSVADASELAYSGDRGGKPRALIPFECAVSPEAFSYRKGWHHFVSAMTHGPAVLEWFYSAYAPRNLFEIAGIPPPHAGNAGPALPWTNVPWTFRFGGAAPEPSPPSRAQNDYAALMALKSSFERNGYLPDRYGDVLGQFLVRGSEMRFLVISGKHRAAALAHSGRPDLPAKLREERPGLIARESVETWPLVARGLIGRQDALRVFDSYFDLDGRSQFDALCRAKPGRGEWAVP